MRKVLLATTALVAMSVTAAQADVSVGGTGVFEIYSPGTGAQTFTSDGSVVIKGSTTTDSGLTFTAVQDAPDLKATATKVTIPMTLTSKSAVISARCVLVAQMVRSTAWTALLPPTWTSKALVPVLATSAQLLSVATHKTSASTSLQ